MITRRAIVVTLWIAAGCTAPLTVAEHHDGGVDPAEAGGADAVGPLLKEDATAADAGLDANEEPDPLSDPIDAQSGG